jgi:cellulose synthase/poly-beta-1,6-N-acetylglucosamine synthase-like glycosyltransferase
MIKRTCVFRFIREMVTPRILRAKREIVVTNGGIVVTLIAGVMVYLDFGPVALEHIQGSSWKTVAAHLLALGIITFLIYGGLVYQLTRLSYLKRRVRHRRAPRKELESVYDNSECRALTILVPAYKEDARVVFLTLMSAALQEHPNRRVVLLIDDPPVPKNADDEAALRAMRSLPQCVNQLLAGPNKVFNKSLTDFLVRQSSGSVDVVKETATLAQLYLEAAEWFRDQEQRLNLADHTQDLFARLVLDPHRIMCLDRAKDLKDFSESWKADPQSIACQYRRLAALFNIELASFERKAYINLSHEPNKAMNLNSYIGVVGKAFRKRYRDTTSDDKSHYEDCFLEETRLADADLTIPDTDYFITLDADSLLSPDYALRLIHYMEQPGNERIAVIQTPYSAIPGPPGLLERVAGATTDVQYVIHQGFTNFKATYWVGANALLKKTALLDIATEDEERGYKITKYIRDRTVIEDTESSIDLINSGWQLYNYPERLSYSATPPDFGSLVIQRRRWANGGLIILPKLLRYLVHRRERNVAEAFMRFHYLTSIAVVNLGLMLLLATPLSQDIRTIWLPVAALPYFFLYMRDLKLNGYRNRDVFRVYALNLLLIPINLGGVLKSMQQAITNKKIAFGRTPKVQGRTAAAPLYILAEYGLVCYWLVQSGIDFETGWRIHGMFVLLNTCLLIYAIVSFIGLKESKEDLLIGLHRCFQILKARILQPNSATMGDEV